MVVDALSKVFIGSVTNVVDNKKDGVKEVHRLARLGVRLEDSPKGGLVIRHNSKSSVVGVKSNEHLDPLLI